MSVKKNIQRVIKSDFSIRKLYCLIQTLALYKTI